MAAANINLEEVTALRLQNCFLFLFFCDAIFGYAKEVSFADERSENICRAKVPTKTASLAAIFNLQKSISSERKQVQATIKTKQ